MSQLKNKLFHSARGITIGMVFMQLLKGCFSIALVMTTASLFGAGIERDSWVIGWSVQVIVFKLLFGPINEVFRSRFIQIKEEKGEPHALKSAFSLLFILFLVSIIVITLFIIFRSSLVPLFAPGYNSLADRFIIEEMILMLIPTLILSELITLFVALLNSYQSFYLPEIFGVFSVLFNIILLLLIGPYWGIKTLVLANYISSILLFSMLIYFVFKRRIFPSFSSISFPSATPYLLFSIPLYFSYSFGQLNAWVERILVSFLAVGHTSALDYARKFIDMPITIIITVGSTVMAPMLAAIWVKEKKSEHFQHQFFQFLRLGLLIISPIVLVFSVGSFDLVELLLHRGNFEKEWIKPTAETLGWFGFGLYGLVFYSISGQALLIQKKAGRYALIGISAQLIPIVINYFFYKDYGLAVFGMSWCIAQYVSGLIMFLCVQSFQRQSLYQMLLLLLILLINLIVAYVLIQNMDAYSPLFKLSALGIFSLVLIITLLKLFRLDEFNSIKNLFLRNS